MKPFFYTIGSLGWLASVALGLYVGVWVLLIGGIVGIIEAAKATPVESMGVAIGVVKILFSSVAGWLSFLVGGCISSFFFAIGRSCK